MPPLQTAPASAVTAAERLRTVMVCVDESEDSLAALDWALKQVVRAGDVVQIIHAVKPVNAAPFIGESERNRGG